MNPPRIGLFSCVHPYYDLPAVVDARQQAIAGLRERGCEVVAPAIPRTPLDAVAAAAEFRDADVDLVVLFFCTWVAEEITLTLAQELMDFPMLLWALPFLDRDIPMPSPMSGLVASSSNIRRMGKRFAWQVGRVNPENLQRTLRAAKVGSVVKELRRARFGVAGSPCPGMMDVEVDEADLSRSLGITTVHLELEDLLAGAASAEPATVDAAVERLSAWTGGEREIDRLRLT